MFGAVLCGLTRKAQRRHEARIAREQGRSRGVVMANPSAEAMEICGRQMAQAMEICGRQMTQISKPVRL